MTDPVPTRASDFVFTKIFTDYENGFWKGAHMRTIDLTGKTAVVTGGSGTLCSVMASGFAENGAKVAIPSDPTNSARALLLLQSAGLVTLKDPTGLTNTPFDVTSNPKNIQITELEAAQIPRSIQDLDAAVINANYALPAGLNPTKDGLFVEKADSPYANLLSVNPGDENKPAIQKLAKALQSPEVKKFIEEHYKGAIIPAF